MFFERFYETFLGLVALTCIMQDAHEKHTAVDGTSLPKDLGECHALIQEQARTIVELQATREKAEQERESLRLYVEQLLNRLYGRRSERFTHDPRQAWLDFGSDPQLVDALQEAAAEAAKIVEEDVQERRRKKKARKPEQGKSEQFPANIPRREEVVQPGGDLMQCAEHGPKQLIGYDEVEKLHFDPASLFVLVKKYPKYACAHQPECGVTQAPRPKGLVEGDRYDTSVAAEVLAGKYFYHMPLYRQQDYFSALGWSPSRSTLDNLLTASMLPAAPLVDYMRQIALASGALGCDETWLTFMVPEFAPMIEPNSPRSQRTHDVLREAIAKRLPSIKARMWAYRSFKVPINVFDFTVSRHREGPREFLANYAGLLMADCYSGFEGIDLHTGTEIIRAACWAHARRKVFEIRNNHPIESSVLLALVRQLYDVEDRAKTLTDDERRAMRDIESRPILARIRAYLDSDLIRSALPKSVTHKGSKGCHGRSL